MSRIISYQYDNDIQDGDAWIGSEASTGQTKQYTAQPEDPLSLIMP